MVWSLQKPSKKRSDQESCYFSLTLQNSFRTNIKPSSPSFSCSPGLGPNQAEHTATVRMCEEQRVKSYSLRLWALIDKFFKRKVKTLEVVVSKMTPFNHSSKLNVWYEVLPRLPTVLTQQVTEPFTRTHLIGSGPKCLWQTDTTRRLLPCLSSSEGSCSCKRTHLTSSLRLSPTGLNDVGLIRTGRRQTQTVIQPLLGAQRPTDVSFWSCNVHQFSAFVN